MDSKRLSELTAAYAEALATLGGAIALTLAATVALTAVTLFVRPISTLRAEVPLHQLAVDIETPMAHDDLVRRLEQEGIARQVQVVLRDGTTRLVLEGVKSQDTTEFAVRQAMGAAGYRLGAIEFLPLTDPIELMRNLWIVIPALAIQAAIFIVIGGLMIWWRVAPALPGVRQPALAALGFGLGGGLVAVAIGAGLGALLEAIGLPVSEQPLLEELLSDPANLVKLAPWIVLAMPIAEEVFFRGYLYRFLAQRVSFPAGLLTSSVLFAVVHMNLSGFLIYLGVGMVFALAYRRTSNLMTPITAHVTYNGLLVLGMLLGL